MGKKKFVTNVNTFVGVFNVLWLPTSLFDDASTLSSFTFLFLFQLFSGFFTQQQLLMTTILRTKLNGNFLKNRNRHTLSFFFLSGVMKPFFAFLALEASSIRLRTSARLRSISACLAFFAC